jgi:hypothetical protein
MWEYFTGLYKNCNKGIKGRGKDRRISTIAQTPYRQDVMANRRDSIISASSQGSSGAGPGPGGLAEGMGMTAQRRLL